MDAVQSSRIGKARRHTGVHTRGENGELSPPGRQGSSPPPSLGLAARGGCDVFINAGVDRNASLPRRANGR